MELRTPLRHSTRACAALGAALACSTALAQYSITQSTIGSGGGSTSGGSFSLSGTIAETGATGRNTLSGGTFAISGGFWASDFTSGAIALSIDSDHTLYKNGDTVTVWISKGPGYTNSAQFFLHYDSAHLVFVGAAGVAPYTNTDAPTTVCAADGSIDTSCSAPLGQSGTSAAQHMIALTFTAQAIAPDHVCSASDLVSFRANGPHMGCGGGTDLPNTTKLSDDFGNSVPYTTTSGGGHSLGAVSILSAPPTITSGASTITVDADAGRCDAVVAVLNPTSATDQCGDSVLASLVITREDGAATSAPFSSSFDGADGAGTTRVNRTFTDAAGQSTTDTVRVHVNPQNTAVVNIELANVHASFTRCIALDFYSGCSSSPVHFDQPVAFTSGHGSATVSVPCGVYTSVVARDRTHTLRRTTDAAHFNSLTTSVYTANFTDTKGLVGGNANDDQWIDILDFGGFVHLYGTPTPSHDSGCGAPTTRNPDFDGDGTAIDIADFSFITVNFYSRAEADECGGYPAAGDQPVSDISVLELAATDYEMARTADVNRDGRLNLVDVAYLGEHGPARCQADFNGDGSVGIADIFVFLNNWLLGYPAADFDDDHRVAIQDIFDFLAAWFEGCA